MGREGGGDVSRWPAPAKINLFLHVTGRRDDGYHTLQTVFQFLEYCDALKFDQRADAEVRRPTGPQGVAAASDLTVRAARLLQQVAGVRRGVDIHINKSIPMGGGLGGGSSNAATTLVALNHLWGLGLGKPELMALGLRLGADVPVFIHGAAVWAEGVGEQFSPIILPEPWYLIVVPPCQVATAEVFNAPELTRNCPAITIHDFLSGRGENVLEPVVRRRYPEVAAALDWLAGFGPARMSGSGACVFAMFDDRDAAEQVRRQLPADWSGFVARGRNRSPLHAMIEGEAG